GSIWPTVTVGCCVTATAGVQCMAPSLYVANLPAEPHGSPTVSTTGNGSSRRFVEVLTCEPPTLKLLDRIPASGVIVKRAFSATFTYGLPGMPGVFTSAMLGVVATQSYAAPLRISDGEHDASSENSLMPTSVGLVRAVSTFPVTCQLTCRLPPCSG